MSRLLPVEQQKSIQLKLSCEAFFQEGSSVAQLAQASNCSAVPATKTSRAESVSSWFQNYARWVSDVLGCASRSPNSNLWNMMEHITDSQICNGLFFSTNVYLYIILYTSFLPVLCQEVCFKAALLSALTTFPGFKMQ